MSLEQIRTNYAEEFYSNCTKYFDTLRKQGKTDFEFEDEYYFTMPALSGKR